MSEQHQCCYASTGESEPCYFCQSTCKKPNSLEKSEVESLGGLSMEAQAGGSDVELPDFSWCDEVLGTNQETMRTVNAIIDGMESESCDSSDAGATVPSSITVTIQRSLAAPSEAPSSSSDSTGEPDSYQLQIPEHPAWTLQEPVSSRVRFLIVMQNHSLSEHFFFLYTLTT